MEYATKSDLAELREAMLAGLKLVLRSNASMRECMDVLMDDLEDRQNEEAHQAVTRMAKFRLQSNVIQEKIIQSECITDDNLSMMESWPDGEAKEVLIGQAIELREEHSASGHECT